MASVVKRQAPIPRWFWLASMLGCTPGFRRSRCKKLLKVTMSRIKLLRGRRDVQVRQLRRDVAQLLQLGQEENAESRLDRLWKEQSLLSAYIKTGEYCQLVKANLSTISLPRECPVDLKEPIASLCFAASCCADLPELQEIRDIMVAKYGKGFLLSAHELLPGKHVNKMFLEAFATKDQSEVARKALLKGIIKEYNIVQPKKPKYPPSHDSQKVPSSGLPANAISKKQQSRDANGPDSDCNQLLALEKGNKHQFARPVESVASKPTCKGKNGEHALYVDANKPGQHKQGPRNEHGQLEQGTTETSYDMLRAALPYDKRGRGRSRQEEYKINTGADEVEGDQHLSSKRKSKNNSVEPENAGLYGLHGHGEEPLPGDVAKGHPEGSRKMPKEKSKPEREVNDTSRGQHESAKGQDSHGQIHGKEKPTYGKGENVVLLRGREQRQCHEALSRAFRANDRQPERDLHYEEQNLEERVKQHDSDRAQLGRQMPDSDCNYMKTSNSKTKGLSRPATESDYMQKDTSFHGHYRHVYYEEPRSRGVAYDFEAQQTCRGSGSLSELQDFQKVQRERKHSSKNSPLEPAEIDASRGAYPDAKSSQKTRKRHVKRVTDFSKLLLDEAANVSLSLPKHYEGDQFQCTEAARRTQILPWVENHVIEAGARSNKEIHGDNSETKLHESAVGRCFDKGHAPGDASIHAMQRRSRRTRKSARKILNGNSINEESMQETIIEANVDGGACFPGHTEGPLTIGSEGTRRRRGHLPESINDSETERNYIASAVEDKKEQRQPKNLDDHQDAQAVNERSCQLNKGDSLPSTRSKPPDRPPPPVPPHRASSLRSRKPLNSPPVLSQRCASLETSQIRAIEEPHVHPNLPEYEDLVASFAALRHKQPKPSSSS